MKSDIGTLIIFYLNRDFRTGFQMFARFELITLYVRPHNVVGFARRYTLRKLARVIGIKLPARFFLIRAPYLYLDAVKRMAVRIPHRPEDQSVWLCLRLLPIACPSPGGNKQKRQKKRQQKPCRAHCDKTPELWKTHQSLRNLRPPNLPRRHHLRRRLRPHPRRRSSVQPD